MDITLLTDTQNVSLLLAMAALPSISVVIKLKVTISTLTRFEVTGHTMTLVCCDRRIHPLYNSIFNMG